MADIQPEHKQENNVVDRLKHTGAITAPSLFTLGNMACGFFSILASAKGNFAQAGWLILVAAVFDMFDGRIARLLGTESSFGVEMDSLADARESVGPKAPISILAEPCDLSIFPWVWGWLTLPITCSIP